ncbi:MAG: substrate-binding domain-containing protein [Prevotellaceae bacterium]|nr:substrate-binding domain-containing protein [Prevotellaceae bacterium]
MKSKNLIIFLLGVCLFAACRNNAPKDKYTDTLTTGVVGISADETFRPIVEQLADVFENKYTNAGIVPFFTSEVDAINLLLRDSVRLAIATRTLTGQEKEYLKSRKFFAREIKIATDGIAVIINRQNTDSLISVSDLQKIMTGKITDWKELNPNSALGELMLVFDNPNSSTVRYAIDSICHGEQLSSGLYAQKDNPAVIDFVAQTPGAIGIIGAAWIGNENDSTRLSFRDDVRVMSVSRATVAAPHNSFKPYQAYLALGDYPLTRNVYILLTDPRNGLSSGFTSFVTSDIGQRIILRSGIVPATQSIRIVNVRDDF